MPAISAARGSSLLLFFFLSLLSVTASASGLVRQVQEAYRKTDSFHANFVQKTHVAILDRDIDEQGELTFAKPGKFLIYYQGKNERKYISDGNTLWIVRPREKELETYPHVKDLLSNEALIFLGGLGNMSKDFRVSEKTSNTLLLIPLRKTAPFVRLLLKIDPESHLACEATLFPKSGNQSRYVFSDTEVNQEIPEEIFQRPSP